MTEMADCGDIRQALGVYVVGAIDPAERAIVDAHLSHCQDCREELAGLAGLPALLGRVPLADAERLALDDAELRDLGEPPGPGDMGKPPGPGMKPPGPGTGPAGASMLGSWIRGPSFRSGSKPHGPN